MSETQNIDLGGGSATKKEEAKQVQEVTPPPQAQSETDVIADTLKDGNVLLVLATFFWIWIIAFINTLCISNDSNSFIYYSKSRR